jgi:putative transposase
MACFCNATQVQSTLAATTAALPSSNRTCAGVLTDSKSAVIKEKVRVAFALDCCDREAIAHVATTEGIKSEDVQDLVITAVENRFGRINTLPKNTLPKPIEWLTDNGSCFITKDMKSLLIDIGMEPCSTPVRSPQSNGMAEAFVKTFKRDYVSVNPIPDAETVIAQLPLWFEHYNTLHPHKALGYQSPREFLNRQTEI